MNSFFNDNELKKIGFKSIGNSVKISRNSCFYGVSRIVIGNHVRIDDFCVISAGEGGIEIGNFVHVGVFSSIQGKAKIIAEDFSGISSRVTILSSNDDFFGKYLAGPTIPEKYTNVKSAPVLLKKHALIGSGALILPGVSIGMGAVVGAMSLIQRDCEDLYIYKGNPARKLLKRSDLFLDLEKSFLKK